MSGHYTVEDCTKLRNFTPRGGMTPLALTVLDGHLTAMLLSRHGAELTDYLMRLGDETNVDEREESAAARIRPCRRARRGGAWLGRPSDEEGPRRSRWGLV